MKFNVRRGFMTMTRQEIEEATVRHLDRIATALEKILHIGKPPAEAPAAAPTAPAEGAGGDKTTDRTS